MFKTVTASYQNIPVIQAQQQLQLASEVSTMEHVPIF